MVSAGQQAPSEGNDGGMMPVVVGQLHHTVSCAPNGSQGVRLAVSNFS